MAMVRPSIERLYNVTSFVMKDKRLKPGWHSMGKLLDAMAEYGEQYDDVIVYLCQLMNLTSDTNRSVFIGPFFQYHKLPIVPDTNYDGIKPTSYKQNGNAVHGRRNVKRKSKT